MEIMKFVVNLTCALCLVSSSSLRDLKPSQISGEEIRHMCLSLDCARTPARPVCGIKKVNDEFKYKIFENECLLLVDGCRMKNYSNAYGLTDLSECREEKKMADIQDSPDEIIEISNDSAVANDSLKLKKSLKIDKNKFIENKTKDELSENIYVEEIMKISNDSAVANDSMKLKKSVKIDENEFIKNKTKDELSENIYVEEIMKISNDSAVANDSMKLKKSVEIDKKEFIKNKTKDELSENIYVEEIIGISNDSAVANDSMKLKKSDEIDENEFMTNKKSDEFSQNIYVVNDFPTYDPLNYEAYINDYFNSTHHKNDTVSSIYDDIDDHTKKYEDINLEDYEDPYLNGEMYEPSFRRSFIVKSIPNKPYYEHVKEIPKTEEGFVDVRTFASCFHKCPLKCPDFYVPVCGAPGGLSREPFIVFRNHCFMDMAQCKFYDDIRNENKKKGNKIKKRYTEYIEAPFIFCLGDSMSGLLQFLPMLRTLQKMGRIRPKGVFNHRVRNFKYANYRSPIGYKPMG